MAKDEMKNRISLALKDPILQQEFKCICKENVELQEQVEKICKTLLDLLRFEDHLDPYIYNCNDAQEGELLKPFSEARDFLKVYECKKCRGSGVVRDGYKGWHESPCPVCEGEGYIFRGDKRK